MASNWHNRRYHRSCHLFDIRLPRRTTKYEDEIQNYGRSSLLSQASRYHRNRLSPSLPPLDTQFAGPHT